MKLKGNIGKLAYQTEKSAGLDLRSTVDVILPPGEWYPIPTGVYIDTAEDDEYMKIVPRSGLAYRDGVTVFNNETFCECPFCKKVFPLYDQTVLNNPGTIDADYPDEIKVILINLSDELFVVEKGDRIAQGIVQTMIHLENGETLGVTRDGGLGSTGVK